MKNKLWPLFGLCALVLAVPPQAKAEILAMMNYETKPEDSLKALKLTGPREREEGIAIMDVDPEAANCGKIRVNIPLPSVPGTQPYWVISGRPIFCEAGYVRWLSGYRHRCGGSQALRHRGR